MSLIGVLILLLVCCLLFWAVRTLLAAFGAPSQIQVVVQVLFVVLVCLWLLQVLGLLGDMPSLRVR